MKLVISKKFPRGVRKIIRAAIGASNAYAPMGVSVVFVQPVNGIEYAGSASEYQGMALIHLCHTDEDFLDTLFHECFHIHQYAKGILEQKENGFVYRGIYIPLWLYTPLHSLIPFELSAKAFARKMCKKLEAI